MQVDVPEWSELPLALGYLVSMARNVFTYLICVSLLELLPRPPLGNEQARSPQVQLQFLQHRPRPKIPFLLSPWSPSSSDHLCYCAESIISNLHKLRSRVRFGRGLRPRTDRDLESATELNFATANGNSDFGIKATTGRPDRMSHGKWRESKQQPSKARSGNQLSCCLVSLHFLSHILFGAIPIGSPCRGILV